MSDDKQRLNAITLHRPWAYAVAHLDKRIENRGWPCPLPVGSLIAIHAGRRFDFESAEKIRARGYECPEHEQHPMGIVAMARFMGNVSSSNSHWFIGPIGWELSDVVAIPPVPCKGKQGLWLVSGDLLQSVRTAYGQAQGQFKFEPTTEEKEEACPYCDVFTQGCPNCYDTGKVPVDA